MANGEKVNWLENWPELPEFENEDAKEAYKGLVRIYLNTWLSLYNSYPETYQKGTRKHKQKYELKEFGENTTGPTRFRPFVLLTPAVQRHEETDDSGNRIVHLIPPEPPPPPKDEEL